MNTPEPVTLTVHAVSAPDLSAAASPVDPRRTRMGRLKMLLVLMICASPVVASYFTYYVVKPEGRTNYSDLIHPPRELPAALSLQTLEGQAVAAPSLKGQWLLLVLAPAACSTECERRLFMQRQLREMLGRDRTKLDKIWLITDDGTIPPALSTAVQATPAATVLRADRGELLKWLAPAAGQQLEDHLYLVDPKGLWMMRMPARPDPKKVKRDIERVVKAASSWDEAGR